MSNILGKSVLHFPHATELNSHSAKDKHLISSVCLSFCVDHKHFPYFHIVFLDVSCILTAYKSNSSDRETLENMDQ